MAKAQVARIWSVPKKSSSSGKGSMVKRSSMNKHKKRSYKAYRGQGK
jgi:hypothetical protein